MDGLLLPEHARNQLGTCPLQRFLLRRGLEIRRTLFVGRKRHVPRGRRVDGIVERSGRVLLRRSALSGRPLPADEGALTRGLAVAVRHHGDLSGYDRESAGIPQSYATFP